MPDSITQAIEARLRRYLGGEDSLADFEAWLVPETWDLSPLTDREAHELAASITLRIAEFTNGDWSEAELRKALQQLQSPSEIKFSGGKEDQVILGLQNHQASFSVVGTERLGAFG